MDDHAIEAMSHYIDEDYMNDNLSQTAEQTAALQEDDSDNILLIIVALAALASFTTPVYQMGNTIRVLRFPFIIMAAWLGLFGIGITVLYMLVHLLHLQSLGRPYLAPIYPPRVTDWKDAFIRLPFSWHIWRKVRH